MRILSLFVVTLALLSSIAGAASVQLTITDELGQPVTNTGIDLRPFDGSYVRGAHGRGQTDERGVVTIQVHKPLRYAVRVSSLDRRHFVTLPEHPLARPPAVTVEEGQESIETEITLIRGAPVVFRVTASRYSMPRRHFVLYDLDRDYRRTFTIREIEDEKELRLPSGRWRVQMQPVPGYLLRAVGVNRRQLDGFVADFEIETSPTATHVSFEYEAPAKLYGRVSFRGRQFPVRIHAELLEAGDWIEEVQARGGSEYRSVDGFPPPPDYFYEMVLPSGRWLIQPTATGLETSDPPQLEIELATGQEYEADFTVGGSANRRNLTVVEVTGPDSNRVEQGWVEVWHEDETLRGDGPIATERIQYGRAFFSSLPLQRYLFVAGAAGVVEHAEVTEAVIREQGFPRVELTVSPGGTLHAVSVDDDGEPIDRVQVRMTRLDEARSLMERREVRQWETRPHGETDSTGHLWIRGVYPGRYSISGQRQAVGGDWQYVEFREEGGEWERIIELQFDGQESAELEIRIGSAASIETRLHCADGSELPEEVDALVFPSSYTEISAPHSEWNQRASLTANDFVLKGRHRDRLHLGPLDMDSYRLVVRPKGHNRWTWAIGTERSEDSAILSISEPLRTDIGATSIDCEPAISVSPQLADGPEVVDWFTVEPYDPVATLAGELSQGEREPRPIFAENPRVYPEEVQFRSLPIGEADVELVVRSPFFLPEPEITVRIDEELKAGQTIRRRPKVRGIGGALKVQFDQAPLAGTTALRLIGEPEIDWLYDCTGETMLIPSLPAGDYELQLCADSECTQSTAWDDPIRIESGKITLIGSS